MAATGYTPIIIYNSGTATNIPLAANLASGELAINYADGKLYYKNSGGTVTLLASAATVAPVTTFSAGTTGFTPSTATSGAVTLAGTLVVGNGGTGLTSLTANYIPYGNGSSAFQSSANHTFDGTNLTLGNAGVSARFQGDFSNATVASRTAFVTGTTNGSTGIYALPNGTSTAASWQATNNATPTNCSKILIATNGSTDVQLVSGINGSGTYLPLTFYNNGSEKMRLDTTGQLYINGTSGTALLTIASSTSLPALKVPNIVETANTVNAAPSATQTFYLASGAVQYYTSNAANNWTVNFAMSSGTTMNTAMAIGDSVSCTMLTTQGSTAYYNSSIQVDGTTSGVTTKWQGGTAPTSGNASSIDSYTYVIYKTGSATYTVLASQTKFA